MRRTARYDTYLLFLVLLLTLALAAGLRFWQLGAQSLWSDEGNSAALATRDFTQIARAAAADIHPPLYYWLLRLWTRVAGASEAGLRSLSAALGVLLVLVTANLGRRLFGRTVSLAVAYIAAIAPFQVYYSQEARMYMLLALEAALAVHLFWWLVDQEDRALAKAGGATITLLPWAPLPAVLLVLVWTLGLYTHYAFPLLIALLSLLYLAWLLVSRSHFLWRALRWGVWLAVTLLLYVPWLPTALRQLTSWPGAETARSLADQVRLLLLTLGLGPVAQSETGFWWVWLLPILALLGALPWPATGRAGQTGSARLNWLRSLLPLAWTLAPLAMILGLGLFRESYLKFLLIGSPAYILLLARGVEGAASWLISPPAPPSPSIPGSAAAPPTAPSQAVRHALAALWIILSLSAISALSSSTLVRYFTDQTIARDDYRGIAEFVMATAQPNDAIVLDAPGQAEVFAYYYDGELPIYALPRQRPADAVALGPDLERLLTHDKVYAVYWATQEADPQGVIQSWLDSRGYKTLDQWRGNVRLAVYVMPEHRLPDETVDNIDLHLSDIITLVGYRGWNLSPTAGEVTQLQLLWRADRAPERRYKVFLQLLDPRDQVIAQRDAEPVGESRPTTSWQAGEVIQDNHGLLIPPGTPPGAYRRIVGMYDAETMERPKLPDGSDFISLPPVTVARAKTPPLLAAFNMEFTQQFDFGGITLLGHDRYKRGFSHAPATPLYPGDLLHLTFYWQANVTPRADWWFELTLNDSAGHPITRLTAPLVGDTYHTTLWQKGEIVRGEHDLLLPADLAPADYRLSLVLLPDENTPTSIAYLGTVKVQTPAEK